MQNFSAKEQKVVRVHGENVNRRAADGASGPQAGRRRIGSGAHFNRQVNELSHEEDEEAYFLKHAPSCDDAAHEEV